MLTNQWLFIGVPYSVYLHIRDGSLRRWGKNVRDAAFCPIPSGLRHGVFGDGSIIRMKNNAVEDDWNVIVVGASAFSALLPKVMPGTLFSLY